MGSWNRQPCVFERATVCGDSGCDGGWMYNAFANAEKSPAFTQRVATRTEQQMARSHRQVCTMEWFSVTVACRVHGFSHRQQAGSGAGFESAARVIRHWRKASKTPEGRSATFRVQGLVFLIYFYLVFFSIFCGESFLTFFFLIFHPFFSICCLNPHMLSTMTRQCTMYIHTQLPSVLQS